MSSPILAPLMDTLNRARTVADVATAALQGVPALIEAAKAEALRLGASEAELAPFTELVAAVNTDLDELVAAAEATPPPGP